MPEYYCECCNYKTKQKGHYDKHLKTKKHLKQQKVNSLSTVCQPFVNLLSTSDKKSYFCKYCDKQYTTRQAMYRHIKYSCKQNKDEDFKELVRLLNERNETDKLKDKQINNMQKQIEKLSTKLQIQNIQNIQNNTIKNNTINYNIQLLNYNQTDYSHLTEKDYFKCITDCNHCVKTLIEKVHFNDNKPENKNIYISNIKNKYVMMYKNNKWQLVNRKSQIDDLYDSNEFMLEDWYKEYKDKYPQMIKSFERYLQNKDNDDNLLNNVKEEILLLLYNNRLQDTEDINKFIENMN